MAKMHKTILENITLAPIKLLKMLLYTGTSTKPPVVLPTPCIGKEEWG